MGSLATPGVAAQHALFWMFAANIVGLLLCLLLIFPGINDWVAPFTYGRWIPVHLNLHLYGSTSLPLVAWLAYMYGLPGGDRSQWGAIAIWAWSLALTLGACSWLAGTTSGKVFLDWRGPARWVFPCSMVLLWAWLTSCCIRNFAFWSPWRRAFSVLGQVALLPVPFILFWSSGPEVYPPVNPETGGPTGVSLLGSILVVVFILLATPTTLGMARIRGRQVVLLIWILFALHLSIYLLLDHSHASHHDWLQIAALGSASLWAALLPLSGACYRWTGSSSWRWACLTWFGVLVVSGWISFLPGYLDHIKFTDGLVAHSHLAMAGFTTSFCMHLLSAVVPGGVAQSLNRRLPFIAWHLATLGYVLLMSAAGLLEGRDPAFTHTSNWPRELLYGGRTLCGAVLTAVSLFWWLGSHRFFQQRKA